MAEIYRTRTGIGGDIGQLDEDLQSPTKGLVMDCCPPGEEEDQDAEVMDSIKRDGSSSTERHKGQRWDAASRDPRRGSRT